MAENQNTDGPQSRTPLKWGEGAKNLPVRQCSKIKIRYENSYMERPKHVPGWKGNQHYQRNEKFKNRHFEL